MSIADWLPYPPPLYINIGFGLNCTGYEPLKPVRSFSTKDFLLHIKI